MRRTLVVALATLFATAGIACAPAEEPAEPEPYVSNTHGLDARNMDLSVDACQDFYLYANGGWIANNPVPPEQSTWSIGNEMQERNYELLRVILEESAASDAEIGTNRRRVGDFWSTGMDTESIEAAGLAPMMDVLERIDTLENTSQVVELVRDLHAEGTLVLFQAFIDADMATSDHYIYYAVQGGLGLPDRDYYTREDDESVALREAYVTHIVRMLELVGQGPEGAAAASKNIMELETRLAMASKTAVELRNPANLYNIVSVADADAATPAFSWSAYYDSLGIADMQTFSFAQPDFFAEMNAALSDVPLETWQQYLRWNAINIFSAQLADRFVDADFDFYGKTLRGTEELRPRWKRVVDQTSGSLGEALGEVYVEQAFPPATKIRADAMIENLRAAVRMRLQALEWMSDETKVQALAKLDAFTSKIGYPDEWRDYSSLEIRPESYLGNIRAANTFEMNRNLDNIGDPIDLNEWGMAPQEINAYYHPLRNEIVFPAAIMQPPFFGGDMDDAVNYGAMGAVIGHEFMHGFDDQGSQFDADGRLRNWWTDEDRARFEERTARLVEQYNGFVAVDDLHVNGELTLGENIGDLAGLTMAYYALQEALKENNPGEIDGFTPEQRFFLSWAQAWRRNQRDEAIRLQVNTDPHSPGQFRTNGPLANMPEFAAAFSCTEGDAMVLPADKRAVIW